LRHVGPVVVDARREVDRARQEVVERVRERLAIGAHPSRRPGRLRRDPRGGVAGVGTEPRHVPAGPELLTERVALGVGGLQDLCVRSRARLERHRRREHEVRFGDGGVTIAATALATALTEACDARLRRRAPVVRLRARQVLRQQRLETAGERDERDRVIPHHSGS